MKITAVDTVHIGAYPNITFVEIHTDSGLTGLGETFRGPQAVAAHIHESIAPYLLGQDPCAIEAHSHHLLNGYLGFASSGAETRGASAIDIALWDIWGKANNRSITEMLGGPVREKIRVYNTCAGYTYNSSGGRRLIDASAADAVAEGPYEDQIAFMRRPAELAQSLLDMGISAMKIWPFDVLAQASRGNSITRAELARGIAPFRAIRDAVGPAIIDIVGGQIMMFNDNEPSILPQIKAGKVRALAVTGPQRSSALPEVPTMEEAGYKGFIVEPWFGFMAPRDTPKAVVDRLNLAFNTALQNPRIKRRLEEAGLRIVGGPPERLGEQIRSETARGAQVIKANNIKAE